jgi:hypothetical protein
MKRFAAGLAVLAFAAALQASAPSRLIGKFGQFRPSTNPLKTSYGTSLGYGGEVDFSLSNYLDLWLSAMYHPQQNHVTATSRASLTPVDAGLKLKLPVPFLGTPYFGVGAVYCTYSEKQGTVQSSEGGLGYCLQAGLVIPPCTGRTCSTALFSIDLFLNYSDCRVAIDGRTLDLGGLRIGLGWGVGF